MCGIVGALSFASAFKIESKLLVSMREELRYRGPDACGLWLSDSRNIGLAHRRLSIIDPGDSASQPMVSNDGRFVLVFNGEIYNHRELRDELSVLDCQKWVTSNSDTEVLLRAFQVWGIDCLNKLRGMFSFAIWDKSEEYLYLVRDRFGIKPLYWSSENKRIVFSSEIKSLLKDKDIQPELDRDAFLSYLNFICIPAPKTLFSKINKVEAGCWVKISSSGNIESKRWYDVLQNTDLNLASCNQDEVLEILTESIELHKESDVPIGVFLSGGLDSSANTQIFSMNSKEPVKTFSIGFDQDYKHYKNELVEARYVANLIGTEHFERRINPNEVIDIIPKMVHLQDEPIADPVCIPLYFLSQLAIENGIKVCQVGEGADELFNGYPEWGYWQKLEKYSSSKIARIFANLAHSPSNLFSASGRITDVLHRIKNDRPTFWTSAQGLTSSECKSVLGLEMKSIDFQEHAWRNIDPIWERFKRFPGEKSSLNWMTFVELSIRLPELLLMRVDKMSMGNSLEARVPFLDHKLVELVMSIPTKFKIGNGIPKVLLKNALSKTLPDKIIHRKKQGFGVPIADFMSGELGENMKSELKTFCEETGLLDFNGITKMFVGNKSHRVWYLYNFALWYNQFIRK